MWVRPTCPCARGRAEARPFEFFLDSLAEVQGLIEREQLVVDERHAG
jgi:hypothetical protein